MLTFSWKWMLLAPLCCLIQGTAASAALPKTPDRVDLSRYYVRGLPTESGAAGIVRSQGGRSTCITFAATGALEMELRRHGYGAIDLSEEFSNYFGKVFWLHQNFDGNGSTGVPIARFGANRRENQLGANGGGGGVGVLKAFASGMRVPTEDAMGYVSNVRSYTSRESGDTFWLSQRQTDDFNLSPARLTSRTIGAPVYYSVQEYAEIRSYYMRDPAIYEKVLSEGHPVVIDFDVLGSRPKIGPWQFEGPGVRIDRDGTRRVYTDGKKPPAHAMLIIGYDRSDPDPANHHFVVRNSWGPTNQRDGLTRIHYNYLNYVRHAGYIRSVAPPAAWPELKFLGIWDVAYDGRKGRLDIYHIPGMSQPVLDKEGGGVRDRRIGTFFDSSNNPYRVNGSISGDRIEFYIDFDRPNLRYDKLSGRRFDYHLINNDRTLAGVHHDKNGSIWGGYANKGGHMPSPFNGGTVSADDMLGRWSLSIGSSGKARIDFDRLNGGRLEGTMRYQGQVDVYPVSARFVNGSSYRKVEITLPFAGGHSVAKGHRLSWQKGVISGHVVALQTGQRQTAFVMTKQIGGVVSGKSGSKAKK